MKIVIASPLEASLVARIAAAQPGLDVRYEPSLLPPTRYVCDHRGIDGFARDPVAQARWDALLTDAEAWFGVPGDTAAGLATYVPRAQHLRWVQGTAAGAGEQVRNAQLAPHDLARVAFTSAAGVHGGMLAEFAFYGLLALRKAAQHLERIRAERSWERFTMGELAGSTIAIVGLGGIGTAIAKRAKAFDMHVVGVARSSDSRPFCDAMFAMNDLPAACAQADAVVATLPGTQATRKIISREAIDAMKPTAIFINVGRGTIVDQDALVDALEANRIAGAVLDVSDPEPLPSDSPLWTLPNVILSPHTAALSIHENARIVDLFIDNLRRLTRGEALRNRVDTVEFY